MSVSEATHSYSEFRGDQDGKKQPNIATSKSFLLFMFVAFVLGVILVVIGSNLGKSPTTVPAWALTSFIQQINGSVYTSANMSGSGYTQVFNAQYDYETPYIIVVCANYADVNLTFWFAWSFHLQMNMRGGGYSPAGWSYCDGCVILDMSNLTSVTLDMENMTVTADVGANMATIYQALQSVGWMAPITPVTNISIGGYTLGGGSHPMNRLLGLAVDSVQQFGALAADQTWLIANSTNSSGLWWALRGGGGGNFAIVVNVTFQAYPAVPTAIGGWITWPMSQSAYVTSAYDTAAFGYTSGQNGSFWGFNLAWRSNATGMFITLSGGWFGPIAEGLAALAPFRAISGGDVNLVNGSYYDVMDYLFMFNNQTLRRVNFTTQSGFFTQNNGSSTVVSGGFNTDVMNALTQAQMNYSWNDFQIGVWIEPFGDGYAVNNVAPNETAFWARNSAGVFGLYLIWNTTYAPGGNQTAIAQANATNAANAIYQQLTPYLMSTNTTTPSTTLAFVSYPMNITSFGPAYYGGNFQQLQAMKEAYDPYNWIYFPQGVPLPS